MMKKQCVGINWAIKRQYSTTLPGPTADNTDNTEPISAEIATFIAEIDCPRFVNVAAAAFYGFLCVGRRPTNTFKKSL